MKHHKYSESHIVYDEKGGIGRLIADAEKADFVQISLGIGAVVDKHQHENPVTFYVISGCGTLFIDDSEIIIATGDIIEVKANASRGLKNDGDTKLEVLVVKHK